MNFLLGQRTLIQAKGADALRYLNGQITNDLRLLEKNPTLALPACVTDAKGRLQAFLYVYKKADGLYWLECDLSLREFLLARLDKYLIADDVELSDLSDDYFLYHSVAAGDFSCERFGVAGYDFFREKDDVFPELLENITVSEQLRISHAVPLWGKELTTDLFPAEAGLDTWAVSFHKGCYIGQEVISRIKAAGKVNQKLFPFLLESELSTPCELISPETGAVVGKLTSISFPHALGFMKKNAFHLRECIAVTENGKHIKCSVNDKV